MLCILIVALVFLIVALRDAHRVSPPRTPFMSLVAIAVPLEHAADFEWLELELVNDEPERGMVTLLVEVWHALPITKSALAAAVELLPPRRYDIHLEVVELNIQPEE